MDNNIDLSSLKDTYSANRNKETISMRLSQETLKIAKQYGKGYTSFLSRLLDEAIKNEELVKKCL